MSLMKWEPREMEPFHTLRNEVDHLFDDFTRCWPLAFFGRTLPAVSGAYLPSVDLKETDAAYTLTADLPGIAKGDLKVTSPRGPSLSRESARRRRRSPTRAIT